MGNPRQQFLAKVLLGSALLMGALGVYFLVVLDSVVVGAVLLVAAVADVVAALVFSRRSV